MTCACAAIARPGGAGCPPGLADAVASVRRLRPSLDAISVVVGSIPLPQATAVALGLRIVGAAAVADCDPLETTREFIRGTMMLCPHLPTLERWGVPIAPLRTLCAIGARLSTTGTTMPTIAAGSITSKAGSARSFVPVPMRDVSAANQIAGSVHSASKYASLLLDAMQTTRSVRGMTDFRVALVEQAAAEHQAIRAFADKAADVFRVSPRLLTLKAAAQGGALAYLKQVYSNQTPGPWSFDDAVAILNDPGVVIRRDVRDRGPVTGPMPGTSPAPFPTSPPSSSSSSIGIAIGALGGFAIGGPMGAVVGAAIGAAVGGDGG